MIRATEKVTRKIAYDERFRDFYWVTENFPRILNCNNCKDSGAINIDIKTIDIPVVNLNMNVQLRAVPVITENKMFARIEEFETCGTIMSGTICVTFNDDYTIDLSIEWSFAASIPKILNILLKPVLIKNLTDHMEKFIYKTNAEVI